MYLGLDLISCHILARYKEAMPIVNKIIPEKKHIKIYIVAKPDMDKLLNFKYKK